MSEQEKNRHLTILRSDLRLARAYGRATATSIRLFTAACVLLEIDFPQVVNRDIHVDLEVLQSSKLVDLYGAQDETKTKPQLTVLSSLKDNRSSHSKVQPVNLRDAPGGMCGDVGRARRQRSVRNGDRLTHRLQKRRSNPRPLAANASSPDCDDVVMRRHPTTFLFP